jgi:hypothetical protein
MDEQHQIQSHQLHPELLVSIQVGLSLRAVLTTEALPSLFHHFGAGAQIALGLNHLHFGDLMLGDEQQPNIIISSSIVIKKEIIYVSVQKHS